MEEIFRLMKCFPNSFINPFSEVILEPKNNVYFKITPYMTKDDILCKIFEWCSRSFAKAQPYVNEKRNNEYRNNLISNFNAYAGTSFNQDDFYVIYDRLGNGIDHEKTIRFISDGCSVEKLIGYDMERKTDEKET